MLLVIMGKSCSGKDTLQRKLIEDYDAKKIITYTTRPIRPGETDGVQYHFISQAEFEKKKSEGFFLESVDYQTNVDNKPAVWKYGSSIESYREAEKSSDLYTVILTRPGLQALKDNGIEHTSILLQVSDKELKARQILRGDDPIEAERRFNSDKKDFMGAERDVDFIFEADRHLDIIAEMVYGIITPDRDKDNKTVQETELDLLMGELIAETKKSLFEEFKGVEYSPSNFSVYVLEKEDDTNYYEEPDWLKSVRYKPGDDKTIPYTLELCDERNNEIIYSVSFMRSEQLETEIDNLCNSAAFKDFYIKPLAQELKADEEYTRFIENYER